jgi:hypothetical protein
LAGSVDVTVQTSGSVIKAELYVDGKLVKTSTATPFSMNWHTKRPVNYSGWRALTVKVYDAAGKAATSAAVSVLVK